MTIPATADVVVIGSGPSGCMAAGLLAKKGVSVVMLDKQTHPRMRVGENIIPHFWKFADMLGATEDIQAANFVQKAGGRVNWSGDVSMLNFGEFGFRRRALHADREEFDHILARCAQRNGAQLFENVAVTRVDFNGDLQEVHYTQGKQAGAIAARYVIDASGQAGVLARQLKTRIINPDFRFRSVWGYFHNSKYFDYDGNIHDHADVRVHPPVTYQLSLSQDNHSGWCWHIPLREVTSIGFVLTKETVTALKKRFDTWDERFNHIVQSEPSLVELMADATLRDDGYYFINDFAGHSEKIAGPGYFMVGDAAGFFDPIYSIGVTLGMYAGSLAAWAAGECLRKPQNEARYRTMFERQMVGRLEIARGVALPHHASAPLDEDRARKTLNMGSTKEFDLLHTASKMSKRGHNLERIVH